MLDTLGKFRHARGFSLGGERLDTLGVLARSVEKDSLQDDTLGVSRSVEPFSNLRETPSMSS